MNNSKILESIKSEIEDYTIPKNIKKLGVVSDIHFPFHDKKALEIALEYLEHKGIDCLLLNGDIIDAFDFSRWHKNPTKSFITHELEMGIKFLEYIRHRFPTQLILWKRGNHEDRIKKYMEEKCHILMDLPYFDIPNWFKYNEFNVIDIHDKSFIYFGKLNIIHGHELGKQMFEPANIARSMYLKTQETILVSHFHRSSSHMEPSSINKVMRGSWSMGCLCNLRPDYARANKWNHGFTYVERTNTKGDFRVENKMILNGEVV